MDNVMMQELQTEVGGTGRHIVIVNGSLAGWFEPDVSGKFWHCHRGSDGMHLGGWATKSEAKDQIHMSFRNAES